MTALFFLIFLAVMTVLVIALIAVYIGPRAAMATAVGLAAWFLYAGLLGSFGVLKNSTMRPPGIAFVVLPVVVFLLVVAARTFVNASIALSFPLWLLLGAQCFRVVVELFLHRLWIEGLIPKMLTFEGANVDIYIGASAPLIAWLCRQLNTAKWRLRVALVWNVLGLLALGNVVARSVLTAPGPLNLLHMEVPNLMMGTFPFLFIPAFFVPLAVVLHLFSIRAISSRASTVTLQERPLLARE